MIAVLIYEYEPSPTLYYLTKFGGLYRETERLSSRMMKATSEGYISLKYLLVDELYLRFLM